ncbi:unnamed protein product, partial [Ectocarpus sp. 13 AM-2016]
VGAGGAGKEVAGVVRWSAEERATVLGLLCDEVSATGVAVDHMKVLVEKETASARERAAVENGGGGDGGSESGDLDGDDSDGDEPQFEAPGDDEAPVRESALVPAG